MTHSALPRSRLGIVWLYNPTLVFLMILKSGWQPVFLHLNELKTEATVFDPSSLYKHITNQLGLFKSEVHNQAKSLGVIFDAKI